MMFELSFLTDPPPPLKKQILDLYHSQKWWPPEFDDPDRVSRVISGSHCFLVALSDGKLAAMGRALSDRTGDAYIHDVTVKEPYRNQGLGSLIVRALLDRLSQDGITWVGLIAEHNSHAFYIREGFQIMDNATPMFKWMI
jgi:spermidine synthase